jgi:hypothetical protein
MKRGQMARFLKKNLSKNAPLNKKKINGIPTLPGIFSWKSPKLNLVNSN